MTKYVCGRLRISYIPQVVINRFPSLCYLCAMGYHYFLQLKHIQLLGRIVILIIFTGTMNTFTISRTWFWVKIRPTSYHSQYGLPAPSHSHTSTTFELINWSLISEIGWDLNVLLLILCCLWLCPSYLLSGTISCGPLNIHGSASIFFVWN